MAEKRDDVRRTTRIIQIDEMLRGGSYVKMDDLIFKFGVNRRTIERDFQQLRNEFDAPIEYDKSRNMYHYSDPTFSVPNVLLTEGDLFTVSTVLPLLEQYKNTPLENNFKHIMEKLTDMLPDTVSVDTSFLNKDISFIKDPLPEIDEEVFNGIFKAVKSRKVITFEYRSVGSQNYKMKEFDSYHVLCQKGNWYILGFDHEKNDIRVYAMSRIRKIKFSSELFKVPENFDVRNHVDLDFGIWNNPEPPLSYELLFIPGMANYVNERHWHKDQELIRQNDGSILLKFKSNQKEMVLSWVLGFGNAVTVLNPPELVEMMKKEIKGLVEKYGKDK